MAEPFGVLWDLDGVLVDTGEWHFVAWDATFKRLGVPFDREAFRHTFGMNNNSILTVMMGQPPAPDFLERISDEKEIQFREAIRGHVQPMPGVRHWLQTLKAQGARMAVASSAPPENIEALVDEMGLRPTFDALVAGYDLPGKPDPAVFLKAARLIGVPPARCVVVEDSVAGVKAAKAAGMGCIAVLTTNPAAELKLADIIVERLDQLSPDAVKNLLGA